MILIRADGNKTIGTGHIMRCLAIAFEFKKIGQDCVFVASDQEPKKLLGDKGFPIEVLDTFYQKPIEEIEKLYAVIEKYKPTAILIDSYYVNQDYFINLRERYRGTLIYIDDLQKDLYSCDILIHYGVNGELSRKLYEERYGKREIPCPKLLLGTSYAPLRDEFRGNGEKKIEERIQTVLVLTGGADVSHTGVQILEYLQKHKGYQDISFLFVVGKMNQDLKEINERAQSLENVFVYTNVDRISVLMRQADIAISAGGTTLFELCACGVPIIIYTCADNQLEGVQEIIKQTDMPYVGDVRNHDDLVAEVFHIIDYMNKDSRIRKQLSQIEMKLVDGLGCKRIVEQIMKTIELA